MQQDAQSVGPDSQFADDDDDDVSINLSDGDDDGAGDSSGEGTQGGESGDEEHLPAPEASQVVCQQSPDSAESPCAEDSQPSPVPINMVSEIPDTPGPENQNSTVDEAVKETHLRKRADLEGQIQVLSLKLNNAKKMYASQFSGYNYFLY